MSTMNGLTHWKWMGMGMGAGRIARAFGWSVVAACLFLATPLSGAAAGAPEDETTWRACDGQTRSPSKATVTGARLLLFPLVALAPDRPPILPPPEGLAEGMAGVEACRAALSDPRSREWPERRTMQHLATTLHLLDAGLRGQTDLMAVAAAKAAWLADPDSNAKVPAVRWIVEPWFDLMVAAAAADKGDPKAGVLLLDILKRRPGSSDLGLLAAEASLARAVDPVSRARLWAHAAGFDSRLQTVALALRDPPGAPFLPDREQMRAVLVAGLREQLTVPVYANRVDRYGPRSTIGSDGYAVESKGDMTLVTYSVDNAPLSWARELALFRAAELAKAAGQKNFFIARDLSSRMMTQQITGTGLVAGSWVSRNDATLAVAFGTPMIQPPYDKTELNAFLVDLFVSALNSSFLKSPTDAKS